MNTLQPIFEISSNEHAIPEVRIINDLGDFLNPNHLKLKRVADKAEVKKEEKKRSGRWSKDECKRFDEALKLFGKKWKKVEAYIGTRSGTQVRSHAQKYFLKQQSNATEEGDLSVAHGTFVTLTQNELSEKKEISIENITPIQLQSRLTPFKSQETSVKLSPLRLRVPEYKYLVEHMKVYRDAEEIYAKFIRLGDWVSL